MTMFNMKRLVLTILVCICVNFVFFYVFFVDIQKEVDTFFLEIFFGYSKFSIIGFLNVPDVDVIWDYETDIHYIERSDISSWTYKVSAERMSNGWTNGLDFLNIPRSDIKAIATMAISEDPFYINLYEEKCRTLPGFRERESWNHFVDVNASRHCDIFFHRRLVNFFVVFTLTNFSLFIAVYVFLWKIASKNSNSDRVVSYFGFVVNMEQYVFSKCVLYAFTLALICTFIYFSRTNPTIYFFLFNYFEVNGVYVEDATLKGLDYTERNRSGIRRTVFRFLSYWECVHLFWDPVSFGNGSHPDLRIKLLTQVTLPDSTLSDIKSYLRPMKLDTYTYDSLEQRLIELEKNKMLNKYYFRRVCSHLINVSLIFFWVFLLIFVAFFQEKFRKSFLKKHKSSSLNNGDSDTNGRNGRNDGNDMDDRTGRNDRNDRNMYRILLPFITYTSFDFSFFTVEYLMLFFIFCLLAYGTVKHVSTDSVLLPKIHFFSLLIVICTFFLCVFLLSSHTYLVQSNLLDTSYIVHYDYNLIVECFLLFIGFLIFFFTYGYNKIMGVLSFEYYIIMLSCLCSFCVFVHANNLIFIYVLIELQSIASYILTSMNKHNRYSIEAGLKYFIIGSFSSILLLFGFSFVYGFSGFIYLSDLTSYVRYLYTIDDDFFLYCLLFSLILVNIGFLFKIYASPFHFWISDIYQGAPTSVTMFLSTIPVFSYFYIFSKFYVFIFSDFFSFYNYLLYFISILSMFSGVFGALIQRKIKKLIAYSSVSTIGYLLASLSGDNVLMVQQCLLYLIVYILNIVPIFIILLNYRINNNISIDNIRSFSSIYSQNKVVFFLLFTFFLSLAGVPPFSGFASKLSLFTALGSEGLYMLLFCGLTTAIISCYYYLRVAKLLFYESHSRFFFFSSLTYSAAFTTGVFFFFNCLFLFFSYILDDISLYVSICLYLSV